MSLHLIKTETDLIIASDLAEYNGWLSARLPSGTTVRINKDKIVFIIDYDDKTEKAYKSCLDNKSPEECAAEILNVKLIPPQIETLNNTLDLAQNILRSIFFPQQS